MRIKTEWTASTTLEQFAHSRVRTLTQRTNTKTHTLTETEHKTNTTTTTKGQAKSTWRTGAGNGNVGRPSGRTGERTADQTTHRPIDKHSNSNRKGDHNQSNAKPKMQSFL